MQALVIADNATATVHEIPTLVPAPGQVRVRVKAIALNPVDALYVAKPARPLGHVIGSDFAGVVESLGAAVSTLHVGDRVAGFVHGGESFRRPSVRLDVLIIDRYLAACQEKVDYPGAFATFLVVDADLVYLIPSTVSFEEAATLPLCINTASNVSHPCDLGGTIVDIIMHSTHRDCSEFSG